MKRLLPILTLLSVAVGCDRPAPPPAGREPVVVTNVVEEVRRVVVTNEVTVVVTNVVTVRRGEPLSLTARKTAPYRVSTAALRAAPLRKLLLEAGARVLSCDPGAVAVIEAPEGVAKALRVGRVVDLEPLSAVEKVEGGIPDTSAVVPVRIVPLSSIDLPAVSEAVREAGGEPVRGESAGRPAVRARLAGNLVFKLAGRSDVRLIERDK